MNDNCVSYRTLKLQIPESPMRPHFVKARVKVHVYPDGSHAVFHGPRCIGRYDEKGRIKDAVPIQRAAYSARRRNAADGMDKPPARPPPPQNKNRKKRTSDALPKPDNSIRYRHQSRPRRLSHTPRICHDTLDPSHPRLSPR